MSGLTLEEQRLIAGCKRNESWAIKKLYELYAPAMRGICMRYTNDKESAKDIMQEGFIKVFTKIKSYSENGSFEGWMRRIFVTTAFDFIRDTHFEMQNPDLTEYQDTIADGAISVIDKLSADEIVKCINELPEGCRLVFNLHAVEGYSHVEIARMLHINEGTSRSQFLHARKLLQAKLEKLN